MPPHHLIRAWFADALGFAFLITVLLLLYFAFKRPRPRRAVWVAAILWMFGVLFISSPTIVNPILVHYERQFDENPACLASRPIVLLGGGVDSYVTSETAIEYMSHATFVRSVAASRLAKQYPTEPVLVAGGALNVVTEAQVMAEYLKISGVDESRIFKEGNSMNTFENAGNVNRLLGEKGLAKDINLVTSALHMMRAKAVFEKQGFNVCPIPTDFQGVTEKSYSAWWPRTSALKKFDLLMHERIAMFVYGITDRL